MQILIQSERFVLRPLTPEDATERYLGWLNNQTVQTWISTAALTTALTDLRNYIESRYNKPEVLFLGIFDKKSKLHIGNIKYEPVDTTNGTAVMGVLIGDESYRGKGVFEEVLQASAQWLKKNHAIHEVHLGVHKANVAAIKAYRKAGFIESMEQYIGNSDALKMILHV